MLCVKTTTQTNLKDNPQNICQNKTSKKHTQAVYFSPHLLAEVFAHVVYQHGIRCDESCRNDCQERGRNELGLVCPLKLNLAKEFLNRGSSFKVLHKCPAYLVSTVTQTSSSEDGTSDIDSPQIGSVRLCINKLL